MGKDYIVLTLSEYNTNPSSNRKPIRAGRNSITAGFEGIFGDLIRSSSILNFDRVEFMLRS